MSVTTCKNCGSMMDVEFRWVTLQLANDEVFDNEVLEDGWYCMDCGLHRLDLGAVPATSVEVLLKNLGLDRFYGA